MALSVGVSLSPDARLLSPAIAVPTRVDRRHWESAILFLLIMGTLAFISTLHAVWQELALTTVASTPAFQYVSIEGVLVDLTLSSSTPQVQLTATDGTDQTVRLDLANTSVFEHGAVLNLAHLRPGQFVKITAQDDHGRAIARSIEIVKSPQEMEPGPPTLSPLHEPTPLLH